MATEQAAGAVAIVTGGRVVGVTGVDETGITGADVVGVTAGACVRTAGPLGACADAVVGNVEGAGGVDGGVVVDVGDATLPGDAWAPLVPDDVEEFALIAAAVAAAALPSDRTAMIPMPQSFRLAPRPRRARRPDSAAKDVSTSCQPTPALHCLWPDHSEPVQYDC
jgi:hypothetical protein